MNSISETIFILNLSTMWGSHIYYFILLKFLNFILSLIWFIYFSRIMLRLSVFVGKIVSSYPLLCIKDKLRFILLYCTFTLYFRLYVVGGCYCCEFYVCIFHYGFVSISF